MDFLGPLSFATPWALAAGAALPLLWWLLRVTPPAPRRITFPAIRFLLGLEQSQQAAAHTPWWLALLRLMLAGVVIAAVAHPLLNAAPSQLPGPLLLVVDDGWASALSWSQMRQRMDGLLAQAQREDQPVMLLTTAPRADGGVMQVSGLLSAAEAKSQALAMTPHPWPTDRLAARTAVDAIAEKGPRRVVWLCDGLEGGTDELARALKRLGPLELLRPAASPKLLLPPRAELTDLTPVVRRITVDRSEEIWLRALDKAGRVLARQSLTMEPRMESGELRMVMPTELRNRVTRLEIEDQGSAAAVVLLDDRWQRRPVGLAREAGAVASPLLDDLYYVERALAPLADLRRGSVSELLQRDLSLAVLPDDGSLSPNELSAWQDWVSHGGVLVRLAGPKLAHNPDALLPVRLRGGGRTLGGAMSWTRPMAVAAMPDSGPFAGLTVPDDLRVKAQVLAEPTIDLGSLTWARLEDGTPLVTGKALGKGWLVLIHTTVWPSWSNLGLSGLFPEMMQRLLLLSQGGGGWSDRPLPPVELLDGFGHLSPPSGAIDSLRPGPPQPIGPKHPPGYYGDDGARQAVNLAPSLSAQATMSPPQGIQLGLLDTPAQERDLQPPLLLLALALFLLDLLALGWLRGRRLPGVMAAGLLVILASPDGHAQSVQAALQTRLAYVQTGDAQIDDTSRSGLAGLSALLARRTTAVLGDPMAVDVEHDPLAMFPLLYWPVADHPATLSVTARDRVNDFLRHGGMILFDTRDGGQGSSEPLRQLTEGLDIPPLTPLPPDHVLTRSFYLLRDLPGRLAGATVYVEENGGDANDNVSPVVIGSHDWAAAWAVDRRGQPLFAAVPGGEQQRELANRFGVNLVMYALTGNYKSDQVHLPAIMERLKR